MTRIFRYWLRRWLLLQAAWVVVNLAGRPVQAAEPPAPDQLRLRMSTLLEVKPAKGRGLAVSDSPAEGSPLRMAAGLGALTAAPAEFDAPGRPPVAGDGNKPAFGAQTVQDGAGPSSRLSNASSGDPLDDAFGLPPQTRIAQSPEGQAGGTPGRQPPEPTRDESVKWALAPIRFRWNGNLSTSITAQRADDSQGSTQKINVANLIGHVNSYVWQPWFAQVNGNLGINVIQTAAEGSHTNAITLTGGGRLNVLPQSRYPFEAFFDATDSRVTGEALGSAFRRTRFGARQNYRPTTHLGNYSAGYERTIQSSFGLSDETTDFLDFRAFRGIGDNQTISGDGSLTLSDRGDEHLQLLNLRGNHFYRPEDNLSLQSDASFVSSKVDGAGAAGFRSQFIQLGSTATWNSEEMPLYVIGGVRFSDSLTESGGVQSNAKFLNTNIGATYDYTRNLRFTGTATLNRSDTATTTSQAAGVAYTSDTDVIFGNFSYQKAASANVSNVTGENPTRTVGGSASHSLTRTLPEIYGGNLYMNFNQGVSAAQSSGAIANANRLTHGANLQWGRFWEAAQVSVGLTATDSRALDKNTDSFQLVTLSANGNRRLSTTSTLSGTMSLQVNRQEAPGQDSGQTTLSTNASASYQNTRMFGVPRLEFNSYLFGTLTQLPSSSGLTIAANQADVRWDNRFRYFLGKSEFQLRGEVATSGGHRRGLLFFYMNRLLN